MSIDRRAVPPPRALLCASTSFRSFSFQHESGRFFCSERGVDVSFREREVLMLGLRKCDRSLHPKRVNETRQSLSLLACPPWVCRADETLLGGRRFLRQVQEDVLKTSTTGCS
ncbi:unnamed protein product [Ectocarpus fasciculatus]